MDSRLHFLIGQSRLTSLHTLPLKRPALKIERFIFLLKSQTISKERAATRLRYSFRGVPKPHKRHYLQQSEYTACVQFDLKEGWSFVPYETIEGSYIGSLESWQDQDVIFKITMPSDIRLEILKRLDKFNLNAFSLFASEESLMETMAFREIDLK
jgi:hypothetical protein